MMRWYSYIVFLILVPLLGCKERYDERAHHAAQDSIAALTESPSESVASSQRTIKPSVRSGRGNSIFNGIITADETRNNNVAVRVGGRIEKLYAKFDYQLIRAGSAVMEIYSPELNTAAEEYLLLYKSNTGKILLGNGRAKLSLMGLTEAQISSLEKNGKVPRTFTVISPYSGYLFPGNEEMKQGGSAGESNTDMSVMNSTEPLEQSYTASVIREGAYVNKRQTLFTVNDMQRVWAMITIDAGTAVKQGDSVLLHIGNEKVNGAVGFIEPSYQQGQKFNRVRVHLENRNRNYKLNDLFTAKLAQQGPGNFLSVPSNSILDLGQRKIVWVKKGKAGQSNLFEARTVTTGQSVNGYVEILSGLEENEEIAEVAGFMIDSESLIER